MEPKYKIGDRVIIVNYGHAIWAHKDEWTKYYESGFAKTPKPDNIIIEDEKSYYYDIAPHYVGREAIIKDVIITQGIISYATTLFSWAKESQLELAPERIINYGSPEAICSNCGEKIYYQSHESVYTHKWDRWRGDNGYFCYQGDIYKTANPIKEDEQDKNT